MADSKEAKQPKVLSIDKLVELLTPHVKTASWIQYDESEKAKDVTLDKKHLVNFQQASFA